MKISQRYAGCSLRKRRTIKASIIYPSPLSSPVSANYTRPKTDMHWNLQPLCTFCRHSPCLHFNSSTMEPTVWSAHRAFLVSLFLLLCHPCFCYYYVIIYYYMLNHSFALNMALHYRLPLLYVSFYKCLKISVHCVSALYLFLIIMRLLRERNIPNFCVFFLKKKNYWNMFVYCWKQGITVICRIVMKHCCCKVHVSIQWTFLFWQSPVKWSEMDLMSLHFCL